MVDTYINSNRFIANLVAVILLLKRKQPDQVDNNKIFKDEVSSLKILSANRLAQ